MKNNKFLTETVKDIEIFNYGNFPIIKENINNLVLLNNKLYKYIKNILDDNYIYFVFENTDNKYFNDMSANNYTLKINLDLLTNLINFSESLFNAGNYKLEKNSKKYILEMLLSIKETINTSLKDDINNITLIKKNFKMVYIKHYKSDINTMYYILLDFKNKFNIFCYILEERINNYYK